jgi:hypothetical protein
MIGQNLKTFEGAIFNETRYFFLQRRRAAWLSFDDRSQADWQLCLPPLLHAPAAPASWRGDIGPSSLGARAEYTSRAIVQ